MFKRMFTELFKYIKPIHKKINKLKKATIELFDILLPYGEWGRAYTILTEPCGIQFIYANHNDEDPGILQKVLKKRKIYTYSIEVEETLITYRNIYYVSKSFNQNLDDENALHKKQELEEYLRFFANLKKYIKMKSKNIAALKAYVIIAGLGIGSLLFLPISLIWVAVILTIIAPIVLKKVLNFCATSLSDMNDVIENTQNTYELEKELSKQSKNLLGKYYIKDKIFYDKLISAIEKINENTEEIYDNYCSIFYDVASADDATVFDVNPFNKDFLFTRQTTQPPAQHNLASHDNISREVNNEYQKNTP